MPEGHNSRGGLLRKYGLVLGIAIGGALLISGLFDFFFTYRDQTAAVSRLEREQVHAAATTIQRFVQDIEQQVGWAVLPPGLAVGVASEQRREAYYRLLRQAPAVTDV